MKNIIVGLLAVVMLIMVCSIIVGVAMARSYTGCDTLGNYPTNGSSHKRQN